jgi:GT2 family glycosyltransferase
METMHENLSEDPASAGSPASGTTVVVCTYGRSQTLSACLRSILCDSGPVELYLVDQNPPETLLEILTEFSADPRFRHILTDVRGKGRALNLAFSMTDSEVVCITDDDCEATAGWASDMSSVLTEHSAGIVFCNVEPGEYDRARGFIPSCHTEVEQILKTADDYAAPITLGAGMAVRKEVWHSLGGFDAHFGPGGEFSSGDEDDFALRALLSGHSVVFTPRTKVIHHGFRTWAQGRALARRNLFAFGAVCGKLHAVRPRAIRRYWMTVFFGQIVLEPLKSLLRRGRLSGITGIIWFVKGFREGCRRGAEPATMLLRS